MGSRAEFAAMTDFVRQKHVRPVVSRVAGGLDALDQIDGLFEDMKTGRQFGKLVVEIATPTGEGITTPLTFTRYRRVMMTGSLRMI